VKECITVPAIHLAKCHTYYQHLASGGYNNVRLLHKNGYNSLLKGGPGVFPCCHWAWGQVIAGWLPQQTAQMWVWRHLAKVQLFLFHRRQISPEGAWLAEPGCGCICWEGMTAGSRVKNWLVWGSECCPWWPIKAHSAVLCNVAWTSHT